MIGAEFLGDFVNLFSSAAVGQFLLQQDHKLEMRGIFVFFRF
jgi:hypothetical protein